jgi:hypothetical protein
MNPETSLAPLVLIGISLIVITVFAGNLSF